jgi:glycosyltransferase involved in cell wall biosynthesis
MVVPPQRLVAIHTGLTAECAGTGERAALRAALEVAPEEFLVAWIGRTGRAKRPEDLAPVARRLAGRGRIVALCADIAQHPALGAELGDAGVLLAPDEMTADELLAACDTLLLTSAWESFPLVVLEAMRARRPVVAAAVGGVEEQITEGVTGFLCRPGDVDAIAARLAVLALDPARRAAMGCAARRRFLELFERERMLTAIERLYREALFAVQSRPPGRGEGVRRIGLPPAIRPSRAPR